MYVANGILLVFVLCCITLIVNSDSGKKERGNKPILKLSLIRLRLSYHDHKSIIDMYGFVSDGTCESHGMKSIHDNKTCKAAALLLNFSIENFRFIPGDEFNTRPTGCSWHEFGNLELWQSSNGECNVNGYAGCFCEIVQGKFLRSHSEV